MGALLTALDVNESAQDKLSTATFQAEKLIIGLMNIYQNLPSNNNKKELLANTIAETTRMMLLKVRQELEMPNQTTPTQTQPQPTNEVERSIYIDGEFFQNYEGEFGYIDILTQRFGSTKYLSRETELPNGDYRLDIISGEVFIYGQKTPLRNRIPKTYGTDLMFELFLLDYQIVIRKDAGALSLILTSNIISNTYLIKEAAKRISFKLYDYYTLEGFAYPNYVSPSMDDILEPKAIAEEIDMFIKQYEQGTLTSTAATPTPAAITHTPPPPVQPPAVTPPMPPVTMPTPTAPPITDTHTGNTGFYDEENYETWSTTQLQTEIEDIRGALELFEPSEPEYQELSYRLDIIEQILENRN
jgi:hypothetical protein